MVLATAAFGPVVQSGSYQNRDTAFEGSSTANAIVWYFYNGRND